MLGVNLGLAGVRSLGEKAPWRKFWPPRVWFHAAHAWRLTAPWRYALAKRCVALRHRVAASATAWPKALRLPLAAGRGGSVPWPIALAAGLGLTLSFAAFFLVLTLQQTHTAKTFEGPAQQYAVSISKDLDAHLEVVKSAGAFFKASAEIDRWAFFQFAREALPRHPGLQAIEWVPRVPSDEREAYEDRALNDGLFGFRFLPMTGDGLETGSGKAEAGARSEHFPIYFVEPFNGNESDLGRDLATSLWQRAALERSRASGRMVVAPPSNPSNPTDLVVLLPVYATGDVPNSEAERIESLIGFVRGVLRLGNLAYSVRPTLNGIGGLDVHIFEDKGETPEPLHQLPLSGGAIQGEATGYETLTAGLYIERRHTIADQVWRIVIAPGGNWQNGSARLDAWLVLLLGLALSAMLLQHLVASSNRTREIERAVVARTRELREAKDKAEEASRAKSDFLAMVGHELRTPLNAINGFSEIMSCEMFGPVGDPRYREYASEINASGNQLLGLINDILDLTSLESGRFELASDSVALGALVHSVCETARRQAEAVDLELTQDIADDTLHLTASEQAVRRILDVLLSNAIKFTPPGGRVAVSCGSRDKGDIVLEVADNGTGIAPEAQKRIFQPFTQSDQSLSRQHEGSGLGLALALRLVELHGGTLELESRFGEGTTVRAVFPAARGQAVESIDAPQLSRAG